ncbi:hypothetical protein BDFB_000079 [Asbolus verrucosus]|uniref:C2H2-type domain-containing protein n=1 Tax=Asbolus verrucosus TaxID=1661398 RepID=A0A482V7K7_ASBVE|nr:hypothetical protein BDFB_000079 [Asbolus verrucosus]
MLFLVFPKAEHKNFAQDKDGRFMCPQCISSYKQKGHLVRHIKYECGVEPQFQCHLCFRKFKHKSNLKAHYLFLHKSSFFFPCLTLQLSVMQDE